MLRNVRIQGLESVNPKMDYAFLVEPEIHDALETFKKRVERQGKGMGASRNTLSPEIRETGLRVESSLVYPRTVGTAWGRKNERILKGMGPRVMRKTVQRIQERWGSE